MKLLFYFLFFIFCIEIATASGFGVSPLSLTLDQEKEIIVMNTQNETITLQLTPSEIFAVTPENLVLEPRSTKHVLLTPLREGTGSLELTAQGTLVSPALVVSINVPLVEKEERQTESLKGITGIVIINVLGMIIGGIVWKNKHFLSSF